MQKLVLFSVLSILFVFGINTDAVQAERYVRKQLKPNFFIPEQDLNYTEKLPEFNYYPTIYRKKQKKTEETSSQVIKTIKSPEQISTEIPQNSVQQTVSQSPYLEYDKDELAQIPEYKQKYDDYIADLKEIAKTGKIPENPRVSFDLMKMSTNERLVVTERFGLHPVDEK